MNFVDRKLKEMGVGKAIRRPGGTTHLDEVVGQGGRKSDWHLTVLAEQN